MPSSARGYRKSPLDHDPEALIWARKKDGRSQAQVAELIPLSPSTYCEIEKGTRNATPATISRLAEILNCPRSVLERKHGEVA